MDEQPIEDIDTPMSTAAIAIHEMFLSLVAAGFSEDQALTLVARISVDNGE